MYNNHRSCLERLDAITFEQQLQEAVRAVIPFESYSLIFPKKGDNVRSAYEAENKRLLLPLPDDKGRVLSVFVARAVDEEKVRNLLPLWDGIAHIISANLLYYKRSLSDPVTGLYTRHYLLERMARELDMLRQDLHLPSLKSESCTETEKKNRLSSGTSSAENTSHCSNKNTYNKEEKEELKEGEEKNLSSEKKSADKSGPQSKKKNTIKSNALYSNSSFSGRASVGMLLIRMSALRDVVREFGYQFADRLMTQLADTLKEKCPEQAIIARTGDSEFAIALPSASKSSCRKLASKLVPALGAVCLEHPLRKEQVSITASIGYVLYPQDAAGSFAIKEAPEQARILLRKARLAAALADEQCNDWNSIKRIMGFGDILAEGGRVIAVLPLSRALVSLGSSMHAREGQRFTVWSIQSPKEGAVSTPFYKGEISLMDVHENSSQAEVLHLGDPAWNIEAGDRLVLLPEEQGAKRKSEQETLKYDPLTSFLSYGDFLDQWVLLREKNEKFLLSLIRLFPRKTKDSDLENERSMAPTDTSVAEIADMIKESFGNKTIGGRYGLNSLIVFHPELEAEKAVQLYKELSQKAQKHLGISLSVGIAPHPFLDFRKADSLENSRKALEYAQLLPEPHIGVLDSLALNISADKKFSHGDTFAAIKEYKLALLADESNILAWNSLGICMASLGRNNEAEEYFLSALKEDPEDLMAHYNLGNVYHSDGQWDKARASFENCFRLDKEYLFALLRLGQLAENEGNKAEARSLYEKAAEIPGGKGYTHRHFARLAISESNEADAREHLHSALLHDPQDAIALQLLAGLYLNAGEDPDMAASLARQSVSLRPDLKSGWFELSRALDAMGRGNEAREARLRAGAI